MEMELEPRVKPLGYKVKATSRESPAQKAIHVLDLDLRTHWSTGTNTKEWILLELDEPCLLSHLRIYNKSVLEWEIAAGLRYKPETFIKVRSRCEAPRREMMYHMNYSPCRYVRISCLRGNPIAIFFIQLIGVPVAGLEPEFQPVFSYLLPQIIAHKQDSHDPHLQLLQDMTNKLAAFLPQIEVDLSHFTDDAESGLRFLAMLASPFYPILYAVKEREYARSSTNVLDSEFPKSHQPSSTLSVSSNFEPRRPRSSSPFFASSSIAFRPDVAFMLLRKAYKDADLGKVCKTASKLLQKLLEPVSGLQTFIPSSNETMNVEETTKTSLVNPFPLIDYSSLFGEDFQLPEDNWDSRYLNLMDILAVEEGILHVLYACASQPELCQKLAENSFEFWSVLPLIQALLPALRPVGSGLDHFDESFSAWRQPYVQRALSQIVMTLSSSTYRPLLHAAAGYLCSFSQSHVKAACALIDLCSSVLAPWIPLVIAKVDLCVELLEDLLGTIQSAQRSLVHVRCALKYILLALSGHMDDSLKKYKEVKHKILFLLELLEPFLDAAIMKFKSAIAFGYVYSDITEKQKHNCEIALNIIRTAIKKSAVLPYLETEWRKGAVAPSVLLSILEPGMELPPEIDFCKSPAMTGLEFTTLSHFPSSGNGDALIRSKNQEDPDGKVDVSDTTVKVDVYEDVSLFFAPPELRNMALTDVSIIPDEIDLASKVIDVSEKRDRIEGISDDQFPGSLDIDSGFVVEYFNLQADYYQLVNYRDCEHRASEFERLALDLHSQNVIAAEGHDAAIDALLLAAECYVNPFFVSLSNPRSRGQSQDKIGRIKGPGYNDVLGSRSSSMKTANLETIAQLEKKRDKVVLQLLLQAAQWDRDYWQKSSDGQCCAYYAELSDGVVIHLSPDDVQSADAVTLARQNQALLCNFLIRKLQTAQDSMHEILLQSLLFLLESATFLSCDPRDVIITILRSAEYLYGFVAAVYNQSKEGNLQSTTAKVREVQRRWMLLQKLIVASSGGDGIPNFRINDNNSHQYNKLIPPSAWMQQVSMFSNSGSPLVRFLGWMAVSRNAKQYRKEQMFLASDLSELGCLLSIFADELSLEDKLTYRKEDINIGKSCRQDGTSSKGPEFDEQSGRQSFRVIHPDLSRFFPNMRTQFESFGESILEAVGLQMRSLPPSLLPDVLCWFADLCLSPFLGKDFSASKVGSDCLKGHVAKNARAIILYILEAIIAEHMEAMVNEIPRLVHVLVSLCRASYCDVSFLGCILQLMRPIISYFLQKASDEVALVDDSSFSFESLCFHELLNEISKKSENEVCSSYNSRSRALTMFILASVFTDLSFKHQRDTLQSFVLWADFTAFVTTATFHDYICAFQCMIDSCKIVLVRNLRVFGAIPLQLSNFSGRDSALSCDDSSKQQTWFLHDIVFDIQPNEVSQKDKSDAVILGKKVTHLSMEEINELCENIDLLINKLCPTMEQCWMLHHQLIKKLAFQLAECLVYSRCLSSLVQNIHQKDEDGGGESPTSLKSLDQFPVNWLSGVQGLGETVLMLLGSHCWYVASTMLDCLLAVPPCFPLNTILGIVCSAITSFACSAPKLLWRLQTDKWLSTFFSRGFYGYLESESSILELFCMLLGHQEPEQRSIALKHLAKLVGQESDSDSVIGFSRSYHKLTSPGSVSTLLDPVLSLLIPSTWDSVTLMASSDTSFVLSARAMTLLLDFIPFAKRNQLQSFLASADTVLHGFAKLAHPSFEGPMLQLSLALIAGACLYSNDEDISLIPENLWKIIETLGLSNTEGKVGDLERRTCQALCCLRDQGGEEKEVLREALSSSEVKQSDPNFVGTRDDILEVLANLTSAQSYIDAFSGKMDEASPAEELEMELEVMQNEDASQQPFHDSPDSIKDGSRLEQIKDSIRSIEKSRLREDIVARRQKKLLLRHNRQKFLEEAALREAELLQDLDRERTAELEKEIDRQQQLEIERAKTRELRHNLDLERERQAQRDLQRELEQIESGLRSSRREVPSSTQTSRSRFRERDSGRSSGEATVRTSSETSNSPMMVLSGGGRSYSGQPPTILQSRDRVDEYGGSYEESNLDGSRDSGDTGSVGDVDSLSGFDTSSQRHGCGPRGGKSRQSLERRERGDGRREGKWEKKH